MNKSIGIDKAVLVRDAKNANLFAVAFSSSVAGFKPKTFFWLGQIIPQTFRSIIVPSQAPSPIEVNCTLSSPTPSVKAPCSE